MDVENLEKLDRVLDDLEALARSDLPNERFFGVLLERMAGTLRARRAALLIPLPDSNWVVLANYGEGSESLAADCREALADCQHTQFVAFDNDHQFLLAVPLRPANFSRGCLVLGVDEAYPPQAQQVILELLTAFAQVAASRQLHELEVFLDQRWLKLQVLCRDVTSSNDLRAAGSALANGLAQVTGAARVSIVQQFAHRAAQVVSISAVPVPDTRSDTVQSLRRFSEDMFLTSRPVLRQHVDASATGRTSSQGEDSPMDRDGVFKNLICLPLASSKSTVAKTALILEFSSSGQLLSELAKLPTLLPAIANTWESQARWLKFPGWMRRLAASPRSVRRISATGLRFAVTATALMCVLWYLLGQTTLIVESTGTFEPMLIRSVYATSDGFVEKLLVNEGEHVKTGTPIIQLRAPELEIRIEQARGELRALEQQARGVRIAINQVASGDAEVIGDQSRLASSIAELETRRESLESQLQLLTHEQTRLTIRSPIDGHVVGQELEQHLAGRPVARGDALFSIADLEGPWQVRVNVADRDTAYVLGSYRAAPSPEHDGGISSEWSQRELASGPLHSSYQPRLVAQSTQRSGSQMTNPSTSADVDKRSQVEFVFESIPHERHQATLHWIAEQMMNEHGEGCFLEVRGRTTSSDASVNHFGAGVQAYFSCGQYARWFVWCRPMVEAIQMRSWF